MACDGEAFAGTAFGALFQAGQMVAPFTLHDMLVLPQDWLRLLTGAG